MKCNRILHTDQIKPNFVCYSLNIIRKTPCHLVTQSPECVSVSLCVAVSPLSELKFCEWS
jgi:hypothetical protein